MRQLYRILLGAALVGAMVAGVAQPSLAQNITNGTLTGVVMDAQKGVLPGATVTAVHTPTGTTYEAITQGDGHFTMLAVRVGGPYTIKASMNCFRTGEQTGVMVGLGESREITFTMQIQALQETVTVTAEAQIIDTSRAGTGANVATQAIESLPTISRSISDFARTSPFFSYAPITAGDTDAVLSVAGRNNRYNNMQIDGAVNNDVFGLASSGTPGGQTGTQPISLDVIQEIQLLVSPYDVRQGGQTGGGINAVTKSGTNNFHGSGYFVARNQNLIGAIPGVATTGNPSPADTNVGKFKDQQGGFTLGGPIVHDKVFFFGNGDFGRKSTPVGYSLDGSSGQTWPDAANALAAAQIAQSKYGLNPGPASEFSKPNNSDKIFLRADFNLSSRNQLTVRTNYVNALAEVGTQSNTSYNFADHFYHMTDKMLSSVGQLNSNWGNAFNELRVVYSRDRNNRGLEPGYPTSPEITVYDGIYNIYMGGEYSSMANKLNQDIVEATDDLTLVKGQHTFEIGTHNEFYRFYNLFIQDLYGGYTFSSLASFQAGIAQGFYHYFSNTSNPLQPAQFSVHDFEVYAGDKWRVRPNVTLTYGVRVAAPRFPDLPHANPVAVTDFNRHTDSMPSPTNISPRVGFNWDLSKGGKQKQLRGGIGVFSGRTPYVWMSNQYGNTGVDFTNLSVSYNSKNTIPFVSDPYNHPTNIGSAGKQTINLVDPGYSFPVTLRSNIGFDHDLGFLGLVGTAEFLLTKNEKDIYYQNINYADPTNAQLAPNFGDYRLVMSKVDNNLGNVLLLSNTSIGYAWTASYKLERPFKNGFYISGSWLYGRALSVNDGTSSVAQSNWSTDPAAINVNQPAETVSNYDPGTRINLTATIPIPMPRKLTSSVSVFYNGQTGRPYALGLRSDLNTDGVSSNDLMFIPVSADQVIVQGGTWDQLNAFLSGDSAAKNNRGIINPRNSGRSPWNNDLDFRYALDIPIAGSRKMEFTADVLNLLNLLNKNWGWLYTAGWPGFATPFTYGGIDKTTGKEIINLTNFNASTYSGLFTRDDLRSRWQAQLGLRFRF